MKKMLIAFVAWSLCLGLSAQKTFPVNGVFDHKERFYAFTGADVYVSASEKIQNATLIIRSGKIISVTKEGRVPRGAVVVPLDDKVIYPAFIDLYSNYGLPEEKKERASSRRQPPQPLSDKAGAYSWNEALIPEYNAHDHFEVNNKKADLVRKVGFGAVGTHNMDGISRGTSSVVALGDENEHEMIIKEKGAHHLSFRKGSSSQNYPSSLMGIIALLRQTYLDAGWYQQQKEEVNLSLEAWNDVQSLPQIFEVGDRLEALRAYKLGSEFDKQYILMGSGDEYQRLEAIKALNTPLILPLNFPNAYDVEDPYDAQQVTLAQLKHWELAPTNPGRIEAAGIPFALTTFRLEQTKDFWPQLRKAIEHGLSEEQALQSLTITPASLLGVEEHLGTLEAGKWANFIITDGNVFEKDTRILHTWVKGKAYVHTDLDTPGLLGRYQMKVGKEEYTLQVSGKTSKPEMKIIVSDTAHVKVNYQQEGSLITLSFQPSGQENKVRLSGLINDSQWAGQGQQVDGNWIEWTASPLDEKEAGGEQKETISKPAPPEYGPVIFPFTAYGWQTPPAPQTYLIKNATVWTNEEQGVLENADVLIQNGKISRVGVGINQKGALEIDGTGMHLTPGIIDEHSHIAISRGVNEGTQASTAEVRIGDVVNSEDVNIYRQLSGGVTTSQLLHGSANPVGGQSAIIKLRWGQSPEQMKFAEAAPFIKFALGENVKQSNWGDMQTTRFPQTRMGVEEVFEDFFTRAREYGQRKSSGNLFRKDLDLEAGLEILEGKRFITCHSYRQSEINMLMKVAERFDFRVNTFTHILEGYKIADKMAAHGAGGSSFSDWWAYKYEVIEAIPYNGALMHEQGVTVAFNSDDSEMARRLNQEAAKAVLFGDVSEEDALKFVTLNPARLLHIDEYVGSIKEGKHADVVLWSGHPLSMYSRAEKTFIDGTLYFDRLADEAMRRQIAEERHRLIQKMLEEKKGGSKTRPPMGKRQYQHYHCDDNHDEAK
jgi:imidazolonepropionase-like amidohydrolase